MSSDLSPCVLMLRAKGNQQLKLQASLFTGTFLTKYESLQSAMTLQPDFPLCVYYRICTLHMCTHTCRLQEDCDANTYDSALTSRVRRASARCGVPRSGSTRPEGTAGGASDPSAPALSGPMKCECVWVYTRTRTEIWYGMQSYGCLRNSTPFMRAVALQPSGRSCSQPPDLVL